MSKERISTEEIAVTRIGLSRQNLGEAEDLRRVQRGIGDTMRGIVADSHTRATEPRSMAASPASDEPWRTKAAEIPREPPPGQDLIDRMVTAQDRADRLELIRKAHEDRAVELSLKDKKP